MVLVQIVVVLWSLMMPMMMSLMVSIEVQIAFVRTRSDTVLCLLRMVESLFKVHWLGSLVLLLNRGRVVVEEAILVVGVVRPVFPPCVLRRGLCGGCCRSGSCSGCRSCGGCGGLGGCCGCFLCCCGGWRGWRWQSGRPHFTT